ncbi:MAG: IS630 family transposase [Armatimonadota bacterium]|nr:IS630 family transposase [Armatimonadota bacterium]
MEVKALACSLPRENGVPLSRFSSSEIASEAVNRGIVAQVSGVTVWRWLSEDAIRPWNHRSWIFPRDPDFQEKAERVLDLYQGIWEGEELGDDDYVISADEKTSIQARSRKHGVIPPGPGEIMRVEHEYERKGALAYLAALDVRRAKIFGRCEAKSGIKPFDRLVEQVMSQELYHSARRVFWIIDNGSSHRGERSIRRLQEAWPNIVPVHLPVHASWLNQIEVYFSIVQRKVLTPNDFCSLESTADRILQFQERYEEMAEPFEWKFTRHDLARLLAKLSPKPLPTTLAA